MTTKNTKTKTGSKTTPKPITKTVASTAKKEVLSRLKDNKADASVGLGKNDNGDYVVVVKFAKPPTKKLVAALSKGLSVQVQTEVVETAVALPKETNALPNLLTNSLVNLTQGVLKAVKQVAKKKATKKTTKKTKTITK